MSYTLGIDIGTYETKGVLVDHEGRVVAQAARGHKMLVPQPGWAEHRPEEDWWEDFVHVCKALLSESDVDPQNIKAVGCSAIGPCMLPVDDEGAPLMNAVLYGVDGRAEVEVRDLTDRIGEDVLVKRCGNALTSQSVGPKILWLKRQRPDIYRKTAQIFTSTSFLVRRLTDQNVIDHYTAANFTPLYDIAAQNWTDDLADDIIDLEKLPHLMWSDEIAGHITAQAAQATGLAEGTPVTAGTIDAAAEALSVGVDQPGDMMMMYGSTIFMILRTAQHVSDARLWSAPWLFRGEFAAMAGLATSGTLTHWFRDQIARDLDAAEAFPLLAAEAGASKPGANGLLFLPYFSGERTPIHDTHAKGAVFGLNLTHTRGDMYRAVIEGIAYGTRHVTETFADLGQQATRLLAVGGGTKNTLWLQSTSDVTGIDQTVCQVTTGASYGDAFLAALAIGAVQRSDLSQWNPAVQDVHAAHYPIYDKQYALFRKLYEQTKDIAAELSAPA
ncbi:FGGY-family carbohydrate kinase [Litoreibacter roseus]|uniref:Sugar kinase n=1 Tax=Litoreibacter roseus TaxID=2601869 RepID=A0A6N6JE73_9RHOB|nr:FGGY-family carbohydrate kinase [Litoreibacter roseus]GFE63679.1 sugar kinase [Litoreibacter roseus]